MANDKWIVRRSRYALRTPWISVRSDDCITPAGVDIAPYYVVEVSDFVHVLATAADKVVLVRQYRHGFGALSLELPGGVADQGETDVIVTGARELKEETGYSRGTWTYVMALSVDPARYTNRLHLVRAENVVAGPTALDPTEDVETILVAREEALRLARTGGILNAAHAAMLLIGLAGS